MVTRCCTTSRARSASASIPSLYSAAARSPLRTVPARHARVHAPDVRARAQIADGIHAGALGMQQGVPGQAASLGKVEELRKELWLQPQPSHVAPHFQW